MSIPTTPWVQSLLLISPQKPPGLDQLREEVHHRSESGETSFSSEKVLVEEQETAHPPVNQPFTHTQKIRKRQSVTVEEGFSVADMVQREPFWPAMMLPNRSLLLALGNGVVVAQLPIHVPFIIHCVVSGQGSVEISYEISGPYDIAAPAESVLVSPPKQLQMRPLGSFGQFDTARSLGIAVARESVRPVFHAEGLHFVVAKLDGNEAGRVPLMVKVVAKQETSP